MASIFIVEYDKVPEYIEYFDIKYIPSTVFFFNTEQMKIDFRFVHLYHQYYINIYEFILLE